ncbi:MAG: phosphatase PAP2 family protein [Anaerolineales bacterium]|nr:phosphatase PAP2 family protein [Chloroflexota bacterium]MBL6980486.1 phosphatase PAP2 family protein [Anaerolineales bacterium]
MDIILFLQNLGDWLKPIMKFFTFLGFEEFYLAIMPAIYWCFDTIMGARLAIMLVVTTGVNAVLKVMFRSPRPYWVSDKVTAMSSETSFGIPSGHGQNAVSLWGTWAYSAKRRWAWIVAIVVAFMIGFSRLYLGMHFPIDVLAGWTVGIILLWSFARLEAPLVKWIKGQSVVGQLTTFVLITLGILLIGNLAIWAISGWQLPIEWIQTATKAGTPPEPFSRDGITTAAAIFFGLTSGLVLIKQRGGFDPKGVWWKRIVRYLLGMVVTVGIWAGLKAIFPTGEEFVPQVFRYIRYGLLGFWVAAGAPLVFRWMKLADRANQ